MESGKTEPSRSGPETSIPRPPTRGGSHGPGPGPYLGTGTTSSSLAYPRPPLPPAETPSVTIQKRRTSSTADITTASTTPPITIPVPNNRSSLPVISATNRKTSNASTNGSSFTNSKIPIFTRPQSTRRTSSSASSIAQTTSSNTNTNTNTSTGTSNSTNVKITSTIPGPSPTPTSRPSNRLAKLPETIDEDDPILDYAPETWIASMIGTSGLFYRFSESLVYKSSVSSREVALMEAAGSLTLRPITRVLNKAKATDSPSRDRTKAVIMEFGKKFRPRNIAPEKMRDVVVDMFLLVQSLHGNRGIVHGSIRPGAFLWGRDGRLKLADFSLGRFIEEDPAVWEEQEDLEGLVEEMYLTPERMRKREENLAVAKARGIPARDVLGAGTPAPTVFDDYFALAVTLWGIFTGKKPVNHQFNTKNIRKSDLVEVKDDLVRRWIRKMLTMAGCDFW